MIQETSEITQDSMAKEIQEDVNSKGPSEEGRQEEDLQITTKADSRDVQMNWADDQEQVAPIETATHATDMQDTEEEAGGTTRLSFAGKDELDHGATILLHDPIQTDNEMTQQLVKTSPKRIKKLKTDRETTYKQGRTRSKTRAVQPLNNIMTQ